jgi:hypothetical protein
MFSGGVVSLMAGCSLPVDRNITGDLFLEGNNLMGTGKGVEMR